MTDEELDRLQTSIDRARAAAQRTFHRSLKELRRLQSEHIQPAALLIKQAMATDALLLKDLEDRQRQFAASEKAAQQNSAKQTQSQPEKTTSIPRSAPCPCKSGEKYKRCCGKNAPPVLFGQAA
jgi:preprotein translocase subunit SecA